MSSQLTHERCSELLGDYLARELPSEQHRLVEDHLEHCAQCSAERAGLAALRHGDESEGLTGDERVQLRAAVLGAVRAPSRQSPLRDESDAVVVPLGGRGSRAGKYLGIAAMLAILAIGSMFVFRGGGLGMTSGDDGDAGSAVGNAEDSSGGGRDEDTASEEPAPEANRGAPDVRPRFQSDRGEISEADLDGLSRQTAFALARSNATSAFGTKAENEELSQALADRVSGTSLDRLAARAPETLASDVTECGQNALDELDRPGLATYATTATIEGEDAIIIGFVTGGRTPDRYAIFAFPRGDCTTILASAEGALD